MSPSKFTFLAATVAVLGSVPACAQSTDKLVNQLIDFSERFQQAIPSLVCDETIQSDELRNGAVRNQIIVHGQLRVLRDTTKAAGFTDSRRIDTVNGQPAPSSKKVNYPYFVYSSFAGALGKLKRDKLPCLTFVASTATDGAPILDYTLNPANAAQPACSDLPSGYHKRVWMDGNGNVTRVERSMDESAARHLHDVTYIESDYAPRDLGATTIWLPIRSMAHSAKNDGRMIVTYSNFHRYTGSATILTDSVKEAPAP